MTSYSKLRWAKSLKLTGLRKKGNFVCQFLNNDAPISVIGSVNSISAPASRKRPIQKTLGHFIMLIDTPNLLVATELLKIVQRGPEL